MRTLRRRLCPFERGPWPRLCGGGPTAPEYSGGGGAMDDSAMDDDEGGEADLLEHLLRPSLRAFDAETDGARAMADVLAHGADRADFEAFAAGRGAADDVRPPPAARRQRRGARCVSASTRKTIESSTRRARSRARRSSPKRSRPASRGDHHNVSPRKAPRRRRRCAPTTTLRVGDHFQRVRLGGRAAPRRAVVQGAWLRACARVRTSK
jgi:hypothetical protein